MSLHDGFNEYGNNPPKKIWHVGEGGTLKATHKRVPVGLGSTETGREYLRAQAVEKRALGQAEVILDGVHCRRDLIEIETRFGGGLRGEIGPGQPDAGKVVYTDERNQYTLKWREAK